MVIALVLLTFALFIAINLLVRAKRHAAVEAAVPVTLEHGEEDHIARLFHPGHSWALVNQPKLVTVGIDNFAQQFIGRVESVTLPAADSLVHQGDPLITLHHRERSLTLVAPLSGMVSEVNVALAPHPEALNNAPYGTGWVAKIVPFNLAVELRNLMRGVTASLWREALKVQMVQWFAPRLGPVLQDGGQLVNNMSDLLSEEEWSKLVSEFFPTNVPQ